MRILSAPALLLGLLSMTGTGSVCAADWATPEEYQANWPRFRGPNGGGVSPQADVPISCDRATGANIAWTADVPAAGFSSPVVWGDRVLLSGGDLEKREVMCFDVATGK